MTGAFLPVIPETVTVHLGPPDSAAPNVTVPFADYIKNVASSEIYPTWPESAIRANVLAQISYTLNRIYTEYYRSRGYDFDITNYTGIDQSFVNGRDIFENISRIVDDIFSTYIARQGNVEPLFAAYCDGDRVICDGLSQWGSVSLARQGLGPYQILQNYYGDDINLINDAMIGGAEESYPGRVLRVGSNGNDVLFVQRRLNRIRQNYPSIPRITDPVGVFTTETEDAVKEFQRIFQLTPDGAVGRSTWYSILRIYSAVKRLGDLSSEGIEPAEIAARFEETLSLGSVGQGVREVQYLLDLVSEFVDTVPSVEVDGIFGEDTAAAVRAFQSVGSLPVTGVVDTDTWELLYRAYQGILAVLPAQGEVEPYPGFPLSLGQRSEEVRILQSYLRLISRTYTDIPQVTVDGEFGPGTQAAVRAYQELFGIPVSGVVGAGTWNSIAQTYSEVRRSEE